MPNVNLMGPSDWTAQQENILRRRRMAELMQQQAMEPIQNPNSQGPLGSVPTPISWTQGLAKALQAYTGARQQADLSGAQRELGQRYTAEGQKALIEGLKSYRGTPGTPDITGGEQGTPDEIYQPGTPAVKGNPEQAMATWASHPMTQGVSQAMLAQLLKGEEPYSLAEGGKRFKGGQVIAENPKQVIPKEHVIGGKVYQSAPSGVKELGGPGEGSWSEPYNLGGAMVQRNEVTGQVRQAVARPPQTHVYSPPAVTTTTVQDPSNPAQQLQVDARTYRGGSLGASGVIGVSGKLGDTAKNEQKLSLGKPQAKLRVETMVQNMDKLDTAIKELDKDPGLTNITGTFYGRTPNVTNTATGAQAKLDSIKSQIFVSALQAMREASKTGGAVGNVSDREGDKLEQTLAALNQAQGTPAFKQQLQKARQQIDISKTLIRNAYEEQFSGIPDFQGPTGRQGSSGGWSVVR